MQVRMMYTYYGTVVDRKCIYAYPYKRMHNVSTEASRDLHTQ